jgi:hypothetical protein
LSEFLLPATPRPGDRVKVIHGEFREFIGNLRSMEGTDGIVEIDVKYHNTDRIQIIPLSFLCKLVE